MEYENEIFPVSCLSSNCGYVRHFISVFYTHMRNLISNSFIILIAVICHYHDAIILFNMVITRQYNNWGQMTVQLPMKFFSLLCLSLNVPQHYLSFSFSL